MSTTYIIDLDRTLIHTDLLYESFLQLIKKNPLYLFMVAIWVLQGRAKLKNEIAKRVELDVANLPYHKELIWFLRSVKSSQNKIYLVTASHQKYADQINQHLKIFDQVKGTDKKNNLKGHKKLEWLKSELKTDDFVYAGDSQADLKVWSYCKKAIVVGDKSFSKKVSKQAEVVKFFERKSMGLMTFVKAIRVHQWAKNSLIFLPLLLAHKYFDSFLWLKGFMAFASFSLCASSVYILNDLLDLDADRAHEKKKNRPLAAGIMPLNYGLMLFPVLLGVAFSLSFLVSPEFQVVLILYYFLTLFYSFKFKRMMIWDVVILALLYTIRIFAGSSALNIEISQWLLLFSIFFFLSLAFVKRVAEIVKIHKKDKLITELKGRGYWVSDLPILKSLGAATGYISALVFALYLNNESTTSLYSKPQFLWLNCVFLIYWLSRVWILTGRDQMNDDPVVFALKDKSSYFVGFCILVTFLLAR